MSKSIFGWEVHFPIEEIVAMITVATRHRQESYIAQLTGDRRETAVYPKGTTLLAAIWTGNKTGKRKVPSRARCTRALLKRHQCQLSSDKGFHISFILRSSRPNRPRDIQTVQQYTRYSREPPCFDASRNTWITKVRYGSPWQAKRSKRLHRLPW